MMKLAAICFSPRGLAVAKRLPAAAIYGSRRVQDEQAIPFERVGQLAGELFASDIEGIVFIGACGIAVRAIAPHVKSKQTDPAVVVIDEGGHYAISLLSGHLGGANRLAAQLAQLIGAEPVITTASDIHGAIAIDVWAQDHGLTISDMGIAKEMEARLLNGEKLGVSGEQPITDWRTEFTAESVPMGLWIGEKRQQPYEKTLWLRPRHLVLGIGCRKGKSLEDIEAAARAVLIKAGYEIGQVKRIASIDIKKEEPGILALAAKWKADIRFYSAAQLREVNGEFSPSAFVQSVTGVDNVCERSAAAGGGRLTVRKTAIGGVTVAVAEEEWKL